LAVL
jgi:hypothetical protein